MNNKPEYASFNIMRNLHEQIEKIFDEDDYFMRVLSHKITAAIKTFTPTDENQLEFEFVKDL